ncbi:TonB-dependent receptor domain-containing protein [Erythrobacter sp. AP23]|uniref:TonB-dependent receptor domain-containing protein n=1 Tax=Erythrobacter sp. AP23 TaxID=499656 RepID=UPI00076C820D|nr:TonB-dependent receptor [Erythrobacter sp. AP23]KWV92526.1 hypothetical protein ASS64_14855 [Erythrobacter sp. AP23]
MTKFNFSRNLIRSSTALFAIAAATAAHAQVVTGADEEEEQIVEEDNTIVVTGSRISRGGFDTLQPTTVVGSDLIEARDQASIADTINELPSFGVPGNSPTGGQSGVAVGQNFLNFFGLGSQRTLTLVDGRRFPPANTPSVNGPAAPGLQVDLNTIPTALIDRVETVAVGGAPIYGSDAIAGTVNIILKDDFEGFEANLLAGITERGDAAKYRAQAIYGFNFNDDRGNIVFNVEWNRQEPLIQQDREETARQYTFQAPADPNSPFLNVIVPDSRVAVSNFNGVPLAFRQFNIFGGGIRDAQGNLVQFSSSGDLVTFDPGTPTGSPVFYSGGDGINLAETASLLTQSDRYYGNIFANYELTDNINLSLQGWYARTEAVETVNQPIYQGQAFTTRGPGGDTDARFVTGPFVVRLDNAFLTNQARGIIAANLAGPNLDIDLDGTPETLGFYVDKGNVDLLGGSSSQAKQDLYRASAGLDGDFEVGGDNWNWDIFYGFGRVVTQSSNRTLLTDRLNQAVDAVAGPNGTVVCRDPSNGCVPLNIFTNSPDPAAVDFVGVDTTTQTKLTQHLVSANLAGKLFRLPAGPIGFAVGAEYREESSEFTPDFILASGLASGTPLTPVSGSFNSKEIYGETLIPIVSPSMGIPLIDSLELEGAIRYVDNSIAGGDITWTAGGRYRPIEDIEFRGNYTRSIRNPAITELFLPTADIVVFANDPCDSRFVTQGANPARRAANCAADGITQPFGSLIVNASQRATLSGNPNLENEIAKAYTFGGVLRPRFLPGFTASVDYVNIKLENAIESLGATTILQSCYDSADFPNAAVCDSFGRDAQGQVINLRTGYVNAGSVNFAGITANLAYRFGLGDLGDMSLSANYQYTDKLEVSVTGTDFNKNDGEIGNNKHRVLANMQFRSNNGFGVFLQGQYLSDAVFNNDDGPTTRDVSGIDDWWLFNLSLSQDIGNQFVLRFNVDNLFDAAPPLYSSLGGGAGINTYFAGLLGRSYSVSAKVRF